MTEFGRPSNKSDGMDSGTVEQTSTAARKQALYRNTGEVLRELRDMPETDAQSAQKTECAIAASRMEHVGDRLHGAERDADRSDLLEQVEWCRAELEAVESLLGEPEKK